MFKPDDPNADLSATPRYPARPKRLDLPLCSSVALVTALLAAPMVGANPEGGVVVHGNAAISGQGSR